jgi:hypothetical protein
MMFDVEALDIGELTRIRIGHDGGGIASGWFLQDVVVDVPSLGKK